MDELEIALEPDPFDVLDASGEALAVALLERGAGHHGLFFFLHYGIEAIEPGPAVVVFERLARSHLRDVRIRVVVVGVDEAPAELARERLAETWRHGSVVRSWLLDLCAEILARGEEFSRVAPVVADSGEGRWTALESIELGVPAPVITLALMNRFSSQGGSSYARKLLAMMRAGFGGHAVQKSP